MSAKTVKSAKKPKPGQVFGKNGVFYTFPQGEGGPIQIRVDFGQVPEPLQYYYYADSLSLAVDEELRMARLLFGRRDAATNKFADRIEVAMPIKSLFGQFWASSREVENTLDRILESTGASPKARPISVPDTPAATLFANMIFVAVGEEESILDFYHLSPREVHFAKTEKKDMQVQPSIRVITPTVLTKHFFNVLRPHAEGKVSLQPTTEGSRRAARSH